MECPRCGAENPDFAIYCSSCSEGIGESTVSRKGGEEERTPAPSVNDSILSTPPPKRPVIARRSAYLAATYAALIALILLALGFALYVYHYERQLDIFRDTPPSFNVLVSLFDIAKTSLYFQIFGQIAAVLALILIIQGAMNVQHRGTSLLTFTHVTLVNTRRLLILALALICTGGAILIYLYELEPDLGEEMARVVSRLLIYLPRAAWIFVTLGLLLIANGLRRRA